MGYGYYASTTETETSGTYSNPIDWDVSWGDIRVRVQSRLAHDARRKGATLITQRYQPDEPVLEQDMDVSPSFKPAGFQGVAYISDKVCEYYGVDPADVLKNHGKATIRKARKIIMYLARTLTTASYNEIGRELDRDHADVIKAVEKTKKELETNGSGRLAQDIKTILEIFPQ